MFEFLFKYPAAVFSRGTFVLLGPWPGWMLAAAIFLAAALLAVAIRRKRTRLAAPLNISRMALVWGLQSALAAILLLLLWEPAISITALRPQQNIIAVVMDDSRSMALADT